VFLTRTRGLLCDDDNRRSSNDAIWFFDDARPRRFVVADFSGNNVVMLLFANYERRRGNGFIIIFVAMKYNKQQRSGCRQLRFTLLAVLGSFGVVPGFVVVVIILFVRHRR